MQLFGMAPEKGRWVLVLLGMIINLCLGTVYAWSVFVTPLTRHFATDLGQQVTPMEMLLPYSLALASFAIAMPFMGKYIDSLGPRKVTLIGGLVMGSGWLLTSTATLPWHLYLMYGVIGGLGVGIAYGVPVAVAARWFPDRRGLAVGLALLGFGFSAFVTANLADLLIGAFGVMQTFRILGFAFIIILSLVALPLTFPGKDWRPAGWTPPPPKPGEAACEMNRGQMVRTVTFYGLWICYFIGCLAGLMAIGIAKPVGTEVVHIDPVLATMLVGFFAIFNGGGRPVFGSLTDRLNPRNTALISFLLIAAASLLMWQVPTVPVYILAFALLWGCLGGWLAIAPTATATYFGTCDYPRCYGIVFLAYGAGAIVGPQLAGFIRTSTGSYLGVFPYVMILAAMGFFIALLLMKPPRLSGETGH